MRLARQFNEREQVFLSVYAAVIFAKYTKVLNKRTDNYFTSIKDRSEYKEIAKRNAGYNIDGVLHAIEVKISSSSETRDLNSAEERSASKVLLLLNDIVDMTAKNASQVAT